MSVHFSFPFTIGVDGSAVVVAQDSDIEIRQNVKVLVLTDVGERLEVPEFGIPDFTFQTSIDTNSVIEAAELWDDRASVFVDSDIDQMVRNVRLNVEEQ